MPSRKQRRHSRGITQFGIIGLAAAFLMLLMTGGLTTMLILAGGKPVNIPPASINIQQSQITPNLYNTDTTFSHIASGVADTDAIYYTAYDDQANWMLEKLDTKQQGQKQESTPLLPDTSSSSLIVLGSANNWVIWLQLDTPTTVVSKKLHDHTTTTHITRTWSLHSLYLGADEKYHPNIPRTLMSDSFDESTAPNWTHTPIQGIWFLKDILLIARIDARGTSHLDQYDLRTGSNTTLNTSTTDGHIFTSPTSSSDGSNIYWSEEWQTDDNTLHSNIWTQQIRASSPSYGRWQPHKEARSFLFRDDETSFHPQVINNTLFLLSLNANTNSANNVRDTGQALPSPIATTSSIQATPTPVSPETAQSITPQIDPKIYGPQIDTALEGRVLAFRLSDYSAQPLPPVLNDRIATMQGGSRFLVYQTSSGNVGLYDTLLEQVLTIGSTVKNAAFLTVNNETAVWISNDQSDSTTTSSNVTISNVKINMFTLTIKNISKPATK
jgi:hypothetical protein